ncbi:MAG: hypothetical protein ACPGF7_07830 [Pontibacterium sp.]
MKALRSGFMITGLLASLLAAPAMADSRHLVLSGAGGESLTLGVVTIQPEGEMYRAEIKLDESKFGDYFLSMRPFKCLESEKQLLCHLPYLYENNQIIDGQDLSALEYQLLFIRKHPNDYGINPWYGIYYQMAWESDPGGAITGQLREVNLDILAAPPAPGNLKPITPDDLYEADPALHWLPKLRIE